MIRATKEPLESSVSLTIGGSSLGDLYLEGHRVVPPAFLMTNVYFPSFASVTFTEHFGSGESLLPINNSVPRVIKRANEQQRIKESLSPFENAFQISTRWRNEESHDHNEGSRLKSIGVHLIVVMKTAPPWCAVASFRSKVEDHIRRKDELVMPGSIVIRPCSVRVVIPKLGTNRNDFIWPPRDADSMLGIICGEASPATDLIVKIFIAHGKKALGAIRNTV